MKTHRLDSMKGGWFAGDFEPSLIPSKDFEVAVKRYPAGASEPRHVHKIATEWTVILNGKVQMCGQTFTDGDIIEIEPGEPTDFRVLEDTITVVVKTPSCKGDKFLVGPTD
ncbi:MAG: hypothetical protein HZB72_04060 [Burkholderiales bacterium]|nr:hypothetical protein [Burkholderiales bacterium]